MSGQVNCVAHVSCSCEKTDQPRPIYNRAGLQTIGRRVGTVSSFRAQILGTVRDVVSALAEESADEPRPVGQLPVESPLERWTARTPDDIGVGIIEAASVTLDVLTFYQERIANEAYLRTAREGDSVEAIVSLLGYELSPGVTAVTHLVFDIEPERNVTVPAWAQVQSVPEDGELPQTFETTAPLAAAGANSQMRPAAPTSQLTGPTTTLRVAGARAVTTGDIVLVGSQTRALQRSITAVASADDGTVLHLSGSVDQDDETWIWVVHDSAKGYGADLPASVVETSLEDHGTWSSKTVERLPASSGDQVFLDRILEPSDVLQNLAIRKSDGAWEIRPIQEMEVTQRGAGSLERTVTRVTTGARATAFRFTADPGPAGGEMSIGEGSGFGEFLGRVLGAASFGESAIVGSGDPVYLVGTALLTEHDTPDRTFPAGTTDMTVPTADLSALQPGRSVILSDKWNAHLATVVEVDQAGRQFEFQPALPTDFDTASMVIHGNLVQARHGERHVDEPIGDGDPTAESQEFKLRRSPLAWRLDGSSPQGATPDIDVRVDDLEWTWVSKREIDPSSEPVYAITARGDDSFVQIGHAAGGVEATRGTRNVVADYRVGGGVDGNVPAGSLETPLDRPPGLRSVSNPLPAEGGTDRETSEHARTAAPAALRATGRIVALPDFEYAALDFPGVAKASATWTWGNLTQLLHVTVAGEEGAVLSPESLAELHRFLDRQRDDRRTLRIDNYTAVPISLRVEVTADERVRPDAVAADVIAAIDDVLGFDQIGFGQAIDASQITERLHQIEAVLGVRWLELSRPMTRLSQAGITRRGPVLLSRSPLIRRRIQDPMPRVAIRGATAKGSYDVEPAELAIVDVGRRDIVVKSVNRPETLT